MIFISYFPGFQLDTIYLGTALYNGELIYIYIYTIIYGIHLVRNGMYIISTMDKLSIP